MIRAGFRSLRRRAFRRKLRQPLSNVGPQRRSRSIAQRFRVSVATFCTLAADDATGAICINSPRSIALRTFTASIVCSSTVKM